LRAFLNEGKVFTEVTDEGRAFQTSSRLWLRLANWMVKTYPDRRQLP